VQLQSARSPCSITPELNARKGTVAALAAPLLLKPPGDGGELVRRAAVKPAVLVPRVDRTAELKIRSRKSDPHCRTV